MGFPLGFGFILIIFNSMLGPGGWVQTLLKQAGASETVLQPAKACVNWRPAYSHPGEYKNPIADYEKALAPDPKIDRPPDFIDRLFSNAPNFDEGSASSWSF